MNIGIIAARQYPRISANTSIAYKLGDELSEKFNCEITHIGMRDEPEQEKVHAYHGHPIKFLNQKILPPFRQRIKNHLRKYLGDGYFYHEEIKTLKAIVQKEQLAAVICFTAPNDNAIIVYKAQLGIPVYLYQLDPFYSQGDIFNLKLRNKFAQIFKHFRHIFTTDLLLKEYQQDNFFSKNLNHFSVLGFPKIAKEVQHATNSSTSSSPIILYSGSFYHKIRPITALLELRKSLPANIIIRFCGSCDSTEDYKILQNSGVECLGYLSQADLTRQFEQASILLNLGNLVTNQLGSKIFDYISWGKPILNIYQLDECPTLNVLKKYPLHFDQKLTEIAKNAPEILNFVTNCSGKNLSSDYIYKNYQEYTIEHVVGKIWQQIKLQDKIC